MDHFNYICLSVIFRNKAPYFTILYIGKEIDYTQFSIKRDLKE